MRLLRRFPSGDVSQSHGETLTPTTEAQTTANAGEDTERPEPCARLAGWETGLPLWKAV